ncbi:MAG: DUF6390 family protein [Egibacteraceae bacterium]
MSTLEERVATPLSGATLFARYAYPPNALGYCGPTDDGALLQRGAGAPGEDLTAMARAFDGAWPYLEFIAHRTGRGPLDHAVVEAYWLGTSLLDQIDLSEHGPELLDRLRRRAGPVARIPGVVAPDARCDHNFHCFEIYPWMGLLAAGRGGDRPREVLDRCRIRWGEVLAVDGDRVEIRCQPLAWDGNALSLGDAVVETAIRGRGGLCLVDGLAPGDRVALHWEWVCDRLDPHRLDHLRRSTIRQLSTVNRRLALTAQG